MRAPVLARALLFCPLDYRGHDFYNPYYEERVCVRTFSSFICEKEGEISLNKPLESRFEQTVVKKIKQLFPDAIVTKLNTKQGIPDRLILCGKKWASLEFKRDKDASHRPNQDWYVNKMNDMSFSRFIYPENKDEVLSALIDFFKE